MIYDNVKALCDKKGMSISALEKAAGLGNATVQGWKDSVPMVTSIKKVADVLGVSIEDIIKEKPDE